MRLAASVMALLAVLAAGYPRAQAPGDAGPPDADLVFRTGVTAARIDVLVTDATGRAVTGLTADDFLLLENGRPRPITTFQAVALPERQGGATPARTSDVATNDRAPGRIFVFALDWVAPCDALRTRHLLRGFIEEHFGPDDLAAVRVITPSLATSDQDFASDRRLLLEAIDKYSGGFAGACERRYTPPGRLRSGRSQQMASLRALVESLDRVPGRKALLLFTQSLEIDMLDVVDYGGGVLGLAGEDARAMLRAATRGGVSIYPIDPAGLTLDHVPIASLDAFRALAGATGGTALINSNSLSDIFQRIVREQSVYYTLGFESGVTRTDGRFVRVEAATTRPGLTVRAPEGYVAPSRDEVGNAGRAGAGSAVARALAAPISTPGVAMRVSAATFRGTRNESVIHVVTEIDLRSLDRLERDGRRTGTIEVEQVVTTPRDRSFPESRYTVPVEVVAGRPDRPAVVRLVSTLALPAGQHQLRVAAGTLASAGGIVLDLDTPRWEDMPYAIGGVVLATPATHEVATFRADLHPGSAPKATRCRPPHCQGERAPATLLTEWPHDSGDDDPGAAPDGPGRWPAGATTARTFARGDTLDVFTEIYDRRRIRRGAAPAPLTITTELHDAAGTVVRRIDASRAPAEPDGPGYMVRVLLEGLADGPYMLRLAVSAPGDPERQVVREVPIRIGPG